MLDNNQRTQMIATGVCYFTAQEAANQGVKFDQYLRVLVSRLRIVEKIASEIDSDMRAEQPKAGGEEEACDCPACSGDVDIDQLMDSMGKEIKPGVKVVSIAAGEEIPEDLAKLLKGIGFPVDQLFSKE